MFLKVMPILETLGFFKHSVCKNCIEPVQETGKYRKCNQLKVLVQITRSFYANYDSEVVHLDSSCLMDSILAN